MYQKATVHRHILCPIGSEWDKLFAWGKVSSEEISVNFLSVKFLKGRSKASGHGEEAFRGQHSHGCVLKTTTVLDWLDITGYGNPVETQNTSSSQKTKNKTKKQYRRKIKKAKKKKKKKTEEAIGEPDLDRDTWSDAGQCHYDRKRQDGSVPNQILCCHTFIRPINPNGSGGICCEIKSQILRLELGEKPFYIILVKTIPWFPHAHTLYFVRVWESKYHARPVTSWTTQYKPWNFLIN